MTQQSLFAAPGARCEGHDVMGYEAGPGGSVPRARRTDPPTSHAAAKRAAPRAGTHAWIVLTFLGRLPLTASDIARSLRGNPDFVPGEYERLCQVRRRLSDLRAAGLIEPDGERDGESCWRRT